MASTGARRRERLPQTNIRLPARLAEALERFFEAQDPRLTKAAFYESLIKQRLAAAGFWPPKGGAR